MGVKKKKGCLNQPQSSEEPAPRPAQRAAPLGSVCWIVGGWKKWSCVPALGDPAAEASSSAEICARQILL